MGAEMPIARIFKCLLRGDIVRIDDSFTFVYGKTDLFVAMVNGIVSLISLFSHYKCTGMQGISVC